MSKYTNILTYLIPGDPKTTLEQTGYSISYTYRGPSATLATNTPNFNDDWNGFPVLRVTGPNLQFKSTISELTVEVKSIDSAAVVAAGLAAAGGTEFPLLEHDEVAVEKSLRQHPAFATMPSSEWGAVDLWIVEPDSDARAAYQYWKRNDKGEKISTIQTLSATAQPAKSAQDFAKLYLIGVESLTDYLPVCRKTELFFGQDKPTVAGLGQKIAGVPFTGAPNTPGGSAYEWVLTAYRASKQGRGYYWTVVREWTGAIKVLVDSTTVY